MATLETKIYSVLTGNATVNAKAGSRIYPLVMPQNPTLPAITYQRISGIKINSLAGYENLENAHITINVWGTAYDTIKDLAGDVHISMDGATAFRSVLSNTLDGYDPETGLYYTSQDFSCWDKTT